jgi:pre-mRNA-splicing factor CWC26
MSLSSYLANKYLTASPAPSSSAAKKRKRKTPSSTPGLVIADDDDLGWSRTPTSQDSDEDTPQTVASGSAEFRRARKSAWKTVGAPVLQPKDSEQDEADRIIKEAAEEGRGRQDDDAPVIEEDDGIIKMGDGTYAGLQSAAAVAAQFAKRKKDEAEAWERESGSNKGKKGAPEETVYRDATGRRIDISLRRAEARRELDEKARKEREKIEEQKGDVQRLQQQKRREELDEARFLPLFKDRAVCYFFFKDDFEHQKSAIGALCTLLHQLLITSESKRRTSLADSALRRLEAMGEESFLVLCSVSGRRSLRLLFIPMLERLFAFLTP